MPPKKTSTKSKDSTATKAKVGAGETKTRLSKRGIIKITKTKDKDTNKNKDNTDKDKDTTKDNTNKDTNKNKDNTDKDNNEDNNEDTNTTYVNTEDVDNTSVKTGSAIKTKKSNNKTKTVVKTKKPTKDTTAKDANADADEDEVDFTVDEEVIQDDDILLDEVEDTEEKVPELTSIQPIKERYEYNPIIKKEIVFVHPNNRITSEILTKFEYTEAISHRAKQIENGGTCYTDVGELTDPIEMAKKELIDKKCPLDLIRGITDKIFERWHVNEMGIPSEY